MVRLEDGIRGDVDAICAGEGALAFEQFFDMFKANRYVRGGGRRDISDSISG